jgi:hypothetical protein
MAMLRAALLMPALFLLALLAAHPAAAQAPPCWTGGPHPCQVVPALPPGNNYGAVVTMPSPYLGPQYQYGAILPQPNECLIGNPAGTAWTTVLCNPAGMKTDASNALLPSARLNLLPIPTLNDCLVGSGTDWITGSCGGGMNPDASNAVQPAANDNLGVTRAIQAYGGKNDGAAGTITVTSGSAAFSGITTSIADVGKLISIPGAGPNGTALNTTIAAPGQLATIASESSGAYYPTDESCAAATPQSGAGSYAAGDTITLSDGTVCTVVYTGVFAMPTIAAAGSGATPSTTGAITASIAGNVMTVSAASGTVITAAVNSNGAVLTDSGALAPATMVLGQLTGTPGGTGTYTVSGSQTVLSESMTSTSTCVLLGTTGTAKGNFFATTATIGGGGGVATIVVNNNPGEYTVNPTILAAEPVSGSKCGGTLTGAQLGITMGVRYANLTTRGVNVSLPTNPIAQASTSGSGTGFAATLDYAQIGTAYYGTNNHNALVAAMASASQNVKVFFPRGVYLTSCPSSDGEFAAGSNVSLYGEGVGASTIQFANNCAFNAAFEWNGKSGFSVRDLAIDLNSALAVGASATCASLKSVLYATGNSAHWDVSKVNFLNMRRCETAVGAFANNGQTISDFSINNLYAQELTTDGALSHCLYSGENSSSAVVTRANLNDVTCVGTQIAMQASHVAVDHVDISGQGYGSGIGMNPGPVNPGCCWTVTNSSLHDSQLGTDMGDSDVHSGIEGYAPYSVIANNHFYNNASAGILWCARFTTIIANEFYNNGRSSIAFRASGQPYAASGVDLNSIPGGLCDSDYTTTSGNRGWDDALIAGTGNITQRYGVDDHLNIDGTTFPHAKIVGNQFSQNGSANVLLTAGEQIDPPSNSGTVVVPSYVSFVAPTVAQNTTIYLMAGGNFATGTAQFMSSLRPIKIVNLYVNTVNDPASGQTFILNLYQGGPAGAVNPSPLTCTINDSANSCSDTTDAAVPVVNIADGTYRYALNLITSATSGNTGSISVSFEIDTQ